MCTIFVSLVVPLLRECSYKSGLEPLFVIWEYSQNHISQYLSTIQHQQHQENHAFWKPIHILSKIILIRITHGCHLSLLGGPGNGMWCSFQIPSFQGLTPSTTATHWNKVPTLCNISNWFNFSDSILLWFFSYCHLRGFLSKLIWQPRGPVVLIWGSLKSIREKSSNLYLWSSKKQECRVSHKSFCSVKRI